VPTRPGRAVLLAVLTIVSCCLTPAVTSAATSKQPSHPRVSAATQDAYTLPGVTIAAVSGTTFSQPLDPGFLGFSFEYSALHAYTGRNPNAINPMLLGLIRSLNPGQSPVLRIGGNSTDDTWWPMPGVIPPGGINYALTKDWLRTAQALATDLNARMIMGINLEADRPAVAATEARAIVQGVGASHIAALEIGNEADLYSSFVWYGNRIGQSFSGRPATWSFDNFLSQFTQWHQLLPPGIPVAGPTFSSLTWMANLPQFLSAEPGLGYVTFHRYPLRGCETNPAEPDYASIPNLLADGASKGLAAEVVPYVTEAHAAGIKFRLDELNSAACTGKAGVSDTFASSLWMLDTLFNMAAVGVDGINVHTLPKAAYEPFTFSESSKGVWSADVRPAYYGMLMFAQADPPGSRLLNVTVPGGLLKVWAVQTPSGHTNIVVINKDPANNYNVRITLAGAQTPLSSVALSAPSVAATGDVTIGGQSFPQNATTATLAGTKTTGTVEPSALGYDIDVPAASAVMLTR
jgi:hypothetical protein